MARPTKYNDELQAKADEYVENYETDSVVPTIAELSLILDISDSTFYEWRDKYPAFSRTLDRIMKTQEVGLVNKSLRNEINPTIAKLMMHNHDYSDRVEKDINLNGSMQNDNEVIVTIVDGGEVADYEG
jgi:transposase-like protein